MNRKAEDVLTELLVLRSQDGDEASWRRLVSLWQPRLYVHARRLTGAPEAARDVTQEAWLAMVSTLRRLEDPARFRAWAYRIVSNKAADWLRRQVRQRRALDAARDDVARRTADDLLEGTSASQQAADEVRESLRQSLRNLSPDQRGLVSMFYNDGMSLKEIADVLNIPEGTVKSRLHTIRQTLRESIDRMRVKNAARESDR